MNAKITRKFAFPLVAAVCLVAVLNSAKANPINLGAAGDYAILALDKLTLSSAHIVGKVGIVGGDGSLLKTTLDGDLFVDSRANPDIHQQDFIVNGQTHFGQNLSQAASDALSASAFASALTPNQTFGNINSSVTFSSSFATGGLTVINISSLQLGGDTLTIQGGVNDRFVINLTDATADTIINGSQIVLSGGVTDRNVLFNLAGQGGTLTIFKDTTEVHGIFLAPQRTVVVDNPPVFGSIIGGDVTVHSRGQVIDITPVPEISSFMPLVGIVAAVFSTAYLRRRKLSVDDR